MPLDARAEEAVASRTAARTSGARTVRYRRGTGVASMAPPELWGRPRVRTALENPAAARELRPAPVRRAIDCGLMRFRRARSGALVGPPPGLATALRLQ